MFMITAIGTSVLLNPSKHIEEVDGEIDGSVIKKKVRASLIIERFMSLCYKMIKGVNHS